MNTLKTNATYFSPSNLITFLGCHHAAFLDLHSDKKPSDTDSASLLLQQKGLEHEKAYLNSLKKRGLQVTEIPKDRSIEERVQLSKEAIQSGCDVIYQAVFLHQQWRGDADFLIKCDIPSHLGEFSYEVLDTKLARSAEPKHILQCLVYSECLEAIQGILPQSVHLFLGDGHKHTFKTSDFYYYYQQVKDQFESFTQNPKDISPLPCRHCQVCSWKDTCDSQWEAEDHLSLIANIQRSQIDKLQQVVLGVAWILLAVLNWSHLLRIRLAL